MSHPYTARKCQSLMSTISLLLSHMLRKAEHQENILLNPLLTESLESLLLTAFNIDYKLTSCIVLYLWLLALSDSNQLALLCLGQSTAFLSLCKYSTTFYTKARVDSIFTAPKYRYLLFYVHLLYMFLNLSKDQNTNKFSSYLFFTYE